MESTPLNDMRTPVQTMPLTPPAVEGHAQRKGIAMIVVFVALLLILALWLAGTTKEPMLDDGQGNPIVVAPEGQIATGFPAYLLPDQAVVVAESYAIDYGLRGESMPYVQYVLDASYDEAVFEYGALLFSKGWTILKEPSGSDTAFYAIKETEEVNITLTTLGASTTDVQISYLINQ